MVRRRATATDALGRTQPTTRRGFGTVTQRKSGNWRASYVGPDGERYAAPRTFATRIDAEGWLAGVQDTIRRETWKPPHVLQAEAFGKYAAAWVDQRRTRKGDPLRPRTQEMYADAISRGMARFATTRLPDMTPPMIRSWHADRTRDAGATQAGLEARVLRAILRTAVKDSIIPTNPCPSELCVSRTGREHRPPTPEELATILQAISPRFRLAVQLAAFGGLRLSEWRGLRRTDLTLTGSGHYLVNVSSQALRVGGQWVVGKPKSAEGVRQVALPAWLTDDVTAHLEQHVGPFPADLLFPSGGSGQFVDIAWRHAWDRARGAAGVCSVVREHDLRHYYGSSLAAAGLGIRQLQSALGHGSAAASLGYLHAARGADPSTADLLRPPTPTPTNVLTLPTTDAEVTAARARTP